MNNHPIGCYPRVTEALRRVIEDLRGHPSDDDAWERLYRLLYPFIFASLFRMLKGNKYLAEESVQETMLRLLRNLDFGKSTTPAGLISYVKQTMQSVGFDLFRRHHLTFVDPNTDELLNPEWPTTFLTENCVEDQALMNLRVAEVMRTLPVRDAEILWLLIEGRTVDEIAKNLNISNKTAYNVTSLAKKKIRKFLFSRAGTNA